MDLEKDTGNEKQVWDPWVRLFHWSLVAMVVVALLTEDHMLNLHVVAGHGVIGLVLFRLLWGFVGTSHALFKDFVRSPSHVSAYLRSILNGTPEHHMGHNPAGGMMVLLLLFVLLLLGVSGLMTLGVERGTGILSGLATWMPQSLGKIVEDFHEGLAGFLWMLIGLHLGGVILGIVQHRENLVQSMITGRKRSET